jgi:uncharacterized protein YegJ (DUF2314 family)
MKLSVIALLSTLSLVSGAWAAQEENEQTAGRKGTAPGQPAGYAHVSDDDKQMDRAVENAQKTLGFFIAALKAKKNGDTVFEIKKGFIDGDKVEHL